MTVPSALDKARVEEARRIVTDRRFSGTGELFATCVAQHAALLAREGWTPPDPDILAARELVAFRYSIGAANIRRGEQDNQTLMLIALDSIKYGRNNP